MSSRRRAGRTHRSATCWRRGFEVDTTKPCVYRLCRLVGDRSYFRVHPILVPGMKLIIQGKFDPPSDRDLLVDPLYVHARAKNANTSLVLFIHGLNGKRYDTWGRLPGL